MSVIQNIVCKKIGEEFSISFEELNELFNSINDGKRRQTSIDNYCFCCGKQKTFIIDLEETYHLKEFLINENPSPKTMYENKESIIDRLSRIEGTIVLSFNCPECKSHYYCGFYYRGLKFRKLFEFPDMSKANNDEYKCFKKLDKNFNYFLEIVTSKRLFSSGAYIGSFVYLRRCIENFIKVYLINRMKIDGKFDQNKFNLCVRFEDFTNFVKDYIDEDLYDAMKNSYSILSKHIHELTEEDCKNNYNLVFEITTTMLSNEIDEINKKERVKNLKNNSSAVINDLKQK